MAKGNERERREKERKREESARLFLARNTREVSFLVGNPSMKGEIWHTAGRNGRNRDGRWDAGWILTSACVSQYPSRPKLDFRNFPESGPPPWRRFTSLSVYWPPRNPLRNFILASGKNGTPLLSPLSISACSFERFNERKGKGQVWKRASSPKAEEDVGEGLRAREQREHDPVHHPFHLRTERRRDNIGLFEDGDDDLRREGLRKRYSRILSRSSSSPPCKKRRPGTNCRTLIWKSDTGERKWAIGASLLPGGRQAFEGSPGSFSLASDRRSNVRQRESSLLLNGGPPFCTRSRETDSPRFHPVEAPPFSFPFHARAEFLPHLPLRPAWILLAIPATVPSPNSFRSPSPRSDASNWKTSNQKTSNIEPFVLPRL